MNNVKTNKLKIANDGEFTAAINGDFTSLELVKDGVNPIEVPFDEQVLHLNLLEMIEQNGMYILMAVKDGEKIPVEVEDLSWRRKSRWAMMTADCQFFDYAKDMHYLAVVTKEGYLAICKWRTNVKGIIKAPYFAEVIKQEDGKITISGKNPFLYEPKWVKVLFISKRNKKVIAVVADSSCLSEHKIEFNLSSILPQVEDTELWEVYLACNLMGRYVIYRVEHMNNESIERTNEDDPFNLPKNKIERRLYNEADCFLPGLKCPNMDAFALIYFDSQWQMSLRLVDTLERYRQTYYEKIEAIHVDDSSIIIKIFCGQYGLQPKQLFLVHREKPAQRYEFSLAKIVHKKNGCQATYQFKTNQIEWSNFYWDLQLIESDGTYDYHMRLRNFSKSFKKSFYGVLGNGRAIMTTKDEKNILFPYYSQNDNVVLHFRPWQQYDSKEYRLLERKAYRRYRILKPYYQRKNIVIFYEKFCKCAQDNSFFMYDYMRKNDDPQINQRPYYIIDKTQPDAAQFAPDDDHVLDFMSLKHMIYLQAAKLLVSIDTIKHSYQWRGKNSPILDELLTKKSVFLQHGVLGLKRVDSIYKRNGGNSTNLFITSSPREKEIVMKYFGYPENEIAVTGLARFDALVNKASRKTILFMPTWRNWIVEVSAEDFVKTDYYQNYHSLISSERLDRFAKEYDVDIIFCMHPKFRDFMDEFQTNSDHVKLFSYQDEPINELLMRSSLLVTDYSSVSWDMYYQEKPIIFYQFDFERYQSEQGSYLDMEHELFGDRVVSEDELYNVLLDYVKTDFKEKDCFKTLRQEYLPVVYQKNHCQHILEEIEKAGLL